MTPAEMTAQLKRVGSTATRAVEAVVERGALNIKREAIKTASSRSNAGKAAAVRHINYDRRGLEAEVGYDKPAGALGTMNEYGSAGNAPGNDLGRALEAEGPLVERYISEAVEKAWR